MTFEAALFHRISMLLSIAAMNLLLGCKPTEIASDGPKSSLRIVATTGMVADLVRQVGGDRVEVEQLLGSGIDPHLYKANTDDVRSIRNADLVFYNGFKLEGRMGDLLGKDGGPNKKHIAIAETIPKESALGAPEHDAVDPHVWMDVSLWIATIPCIEKELARRLPEHSSEFSGRAAAIRTRLESLEATAKRWIDTIPIDQRILITSHDAFRYFGKRYGLQVEGIQGVSTSSEAGLRRIRELVDLIVERKVPSAFVESSVPGKSVQSLIEGAAQRGVAIKIGGELYSDAMGPQGSGADTYEGMMLHNFKTIVTALGGRTDAN
jgi:manganese/zinc/iron transport system substrate-binding protein